MIYFLIINGLPGYAEVILLDNIDYFNEETLLWSSSFEVFINESGFVVLGVDASL